MGSRGNYRKPRKEVDPDEMLRKINQYTMESSSNHQRPLRVNFDLYDDSDIGFKLELIGLMIHNLRELQDAAHEAHQTGSGIVYDKVVHKVKATVTLLDDAEFSDNIEDISNTLKEMSPAAEGKLKIFHQLIESIIHSLEREMQLLKTS